MDNVEKNQELSKNGELLVDKFVDNVCKIDFSVYLFYSSLTIIHSSYKFSSLPAIFSLSLESSTILSKSS